MQELLETLVVLSDAWMCPCCSSQACLPGSVDIASCLPSSPCSRCWRVLGVRLLMVSPGAGCFDWLISNWALSVWLLWRLYSLPSHGHRRAVLKPLGCYLESDFWTGQPWNTFCIVLGNIPQASGVQEVTFTTQQPMTNDFQPLELSSDGWELPWGPQGFLNAHSSHLGNLEGLHLGWDHRISGSCSAMWQTLHENPPSSWTSWLSLPDYKQEFGRAEGMWEVGVSPQECPLHRFSKSFLCACWVSEPTSLLSAVHA